MPPLKRGRGRPRKDPSQPGYSGRGRGRGGSGAPLLPLGPGEFIGMRWRVAVEGRPVGAVELACSALAEALAGGKLEFTKEEIEGIGLQGQTLEALSCIASDGRWYTPDLPLPPGAAAAPVAAPAPPPPPPPPPKPPPEPVGPQWGSEEDSELLHRIPIRSPQADRRALLAEARTTRRRRGARLRVGVRVLEEGAARGDELVEVVELACCEGVSLVVPTAATRELACL